MYSRPPPAYRSGPTRFCLTDVSILSYIVILVNTFLNLFITKLFYIILCIMPKEAIIAVMTPQKQRFVEEYLIDLNETQAAIRAGYSAKTAYSQGNRLMKDVEVETAINEAMEERSKRTEITADRVLQELAHIAFDDIKNYLSFRTEKTLIDYDENGKPIIGYKQVIEIMDSDTIDTRNISEVSINAKGVFTFKQYCKDVALVNLGKHLGMFTDRKEIEIGNKTLDAMAMNIPLSEKLAAIKLAAAAIDEITDE